MIEKNNRAEILKLSKQLKSAYRKYKTYIYYENHSPIQRAELAKFEFEVFECGIILERCIFLEESLCEKNKNCEDCEFNSSLNNFDNDFNIEKHFEKVIEYEKYGEEFKENYKKNVNTFFETFADELINNTEKIFERLLNRIEILAFPKKIRVKNKYKNKYKNPPIVIKNIREEKNYVEQSHYFISLPVETHILGVLWILRSGWVLDHKLYGNSYGNRINNNVLKKIEEEFKKGEHYEEFNPFLFDAYFKKYQSWRDDGLDEVNNILDNDKNAIMISLDFKDYFYSSTINFDDLKCDINNTKKIILKNYKKSNHLNGKIDLDNKLIDFIEDVFIKYSKSFNRKGYNKKIIFNRCKEEILELYKKYYKNTSSKEISIDILDKIVENDIDLEDNNGELAKKKRKIIDILKKEFKDKKNYIDLENFNKLEAEVREKIHEYSNCFYYKNGSNKEEYKTLPMIPLGFLPSLIISNWNLHGFDQAILEKLAPDYYGRYVDDLLIVLSDAKKSDSNCTKNLESIGLSEIMNQYLTPKDPEPHNTIFKLYPDPDYDYEKEINSKVNEKCENYKKNEKCENYKKDSVYKAQSQHIDCPNGTNYNNKTIHFYYDNLEIQKNKLKLFIFSHENSRAMINKFRNEIYHTISEFRLMHDVDKIFRDLEGDIYSINYEGSINKLKDINYAEINKFELSKNISRLTYDFSYVSDYNKNKMIDEIINSFEGNLLEFMILWEKLFTLLLVVNDKEKFKNQLHKILNLIKNIEINCNYSNNPCSFKIVSPKKKKEKEILNTSLIKFLYYSCKRVLSLKEFDLDLDKIFEKEHEEEFKKHLGFSKINEDILINTNNHIPVIKINYGNLFSYFFISSSLQNNILMKDPLQNLDKIKRNLIKNKKYDLINYIYKENYFNKFCYPRYVQFHECTLNILNRNLFNQNNKSHEKLYHSKYLEESHELYNKLNFLHYEDNNNKKPEESNFYKNECKKCYENKKIKCPENYSKNDKYGIYEDFCIDVIKSGKEKKDKINIGLVNTKLEFNNFSDALKGKPNRSSKRLSEIIKIINEATQKDKKVDLLLMPENFIPYDWIDMIVEMSRKHQIAMIFGVEHVINNGYVGNYIAMTLPSKDEENGYLNCVITLRLKNAYAPIEIQEFGKRGLNPLKNEKIHHILCVWNDVYIAPYYCYEIADIRERSIFKSCCDIIAISEYNKDVKYFNNIAESLVRDLFCYCIKSNTSEYGGTCVLQPTSSEKKYFVQLKGGESNYVVTQTLKILKLREEQINTYGSQNKDAYFKHQPPNFNSDIVRFRMGLPFFDTENRN